MIKSCITRGTHVSRQIRMMLNKDDLVLIDILCIFTFNNFYHLLKKFLVFLCFRKVIFRSDFGSPRDLGNKKWREK
jgi:hypothetical protein